MSTLKDIYQRLKKELQNNEAELEARIILETILNMDSSELISEADTKLTRNQIKKIMDIVEVRNKEKTPLAYILEEAHFMDLKLFVNDDVLIPRPETELVVEKVLNEIKERKIYQPTILDLCTGSGCIAIALKKAIPAAKLYASDISKAALNVAAINAKRYKTEINYVMGDYLDPFLNLSSSPIAVPIMKGQPPYFDVIVCNPPYISASEYEELEDEVKHEPRHALVGFPYADIKRHGEKLLKAGGFMAFEFGFSHDQNYRKKLEEIFPKADFYQDFESHDRYFIWDAQRLEEEKKILGFDPLQSEQ